MSLTRILIVCALLIVAAAGVGYWGAIQALPGFTMTRAMERMEAFAGGPNRMIHRPATTHESRTIVMPAPDLMYSVCVYDLSSGPVRVRAPITPGYMSVSGYQGNTDNFFSINASRIPVGSGEIDFTIAHAQPGYRAGDAQINAPDLGAIVSPSMKGIVLIRRFVDPRLDLEDLKAAQKQDTCESAA